LCDTQLVLGFKAQKDNITITINMHFLNKTPIQLCTLITVANCDQLSRLISEDFNTISNQIICHNRTNTNPSQSCLRLIPLFETQEWPIHFKTIPHVVLSYDIINMRSWQISLLQLVKVLHHICLSLPIETTMTDSHFKWKQRNGTLYNPTCC
jgi:hypothetical protein